VRRKKEQGTATEDFAMTILAGRAVGWTRTILLRVPAGAAVLFAAAVPAEAAAQSGEEATSPPKIQWNSPFPRVAFDVTKGRPAVQVRVNGAGPFTLLLDTMNPDSTLDDDLVRLLRLKPAPGYEAGENDDPKWWTPEVARVESLDMGGGVITDFDVVVSDYDLLAGGEREFDGTVSLSLFADCLLTIDFPRQYLTLKRGKLPAAANSDVLDYTSQRGLFIIPLSFGETVVRVAIDAGIEDAFVLDEGLRRSVPLRADPTARKQSVVGGQENPPQAYFDGIVRFGRHTLVEPPVTFRSGGSSVGQRILRHFSLTIDQRNHRLRFVRPGRGPITFDPPSKFGLVFENKRGLVIVTLVVPGSPASRRAVKPGDIVLEIEGRTAREYEVLELRELLQVSSIITLKLDRDGFPLLIVLDAER
jgi:hypothetical protein